MIEVWVAAASASFYWHRRQQQTGLQLKSELILLLQLVDQVDIFRGSPVSPIPQIKQSDIHIYAFLYIEYIILRLSRDCQRSHFQFVALSDSLMKAMIASRKKVVLLLL